jgi:hypothetical protein
MIVATEATREGESNTGLRPAVLVAIEPRSYSEAIGRALEVLRPGLAVRVVEPADLVAEVSRLDPDLVVCSQPRVSAASSEARWIEYYPYDERAPIRVDGRSEDLAQITLEDLFAVIDRTLL